MRALKFFPVFLAFLFLAHLSYAKFQRMRIPKGTFSLSGTKTNIPATCIDGDARPTPSTGDFFKYAQSNIMLVGESGGVVVQLLPLEEAIENKIISIEGIDSFNQVAVELLQPKAGVRYQIKVEDELGIIGGADDFTEEVKVLLSYKEELKKLDDYYNELQKNSLSKEQLADWFHQERYNIESELLHSDYSKAEITEQVEVLIKDFKRYNTNLLAHQDELNRLSSFYNEKIITKDQLIEGVFKSKKAELYDNVLFADISKAESSAFVDQLIADLEKHVRFSQVFDTEDPLYKNFSFCYFCGYDEISRADIRSVLPVFLPDKKLLDVDYLNLINRKDLTDTQLGFLEKEFNIKLPAYTGKYKNFAFLDFTRYDEPKEEMIKRARRAKFVVTNGVDSYSSRIDTDEVLKEFNSRNFIELNRFNENQQEGFKQIKFIVVGSENPMKIKELYETTLDLAEPLATKIKSIKSNPDFVVVEDKKAFEAALKEYKELGFKTITLFHNREDGTLFDELYFYYENLQDVLTCSSVTIKELPFTLQTTGLIDVEHTLDAMIHAKAKLVPGTDNMNDFYYHFTNDYANQEFKQKLEIAGYVVGGVGVVGSGVALIFYAKEMDQDTDETNEK